MFFSILLYVLGLFVCPKRLCLHRFSLRARLTLPGGRGGSLHAKLRQKVAPALSQQQLLLLVPQIQGLCRQVLEEMAEESAKEGATSLVPRTNRLTQSVAAASLLGALAAPNLPYLSRLSDLLDEVIAGLFTVPVEKSFGKLTPFGRAVQAKRQASELIDEMMDEARRRQAGAGAEDSDPSQQGPEAPGDVLARLAQDTQEGEALSPAEVQDTVLTVGFAGKVTAAAALPVAVAELARRPLWREALAKDAKDAQLGGGIPPHSLRFYPFKATT